VARKPTTESTAAAATEPAPANPPHRPPLYLEQYAPAATKLCEFGGTDIDLAEAFGVTDRTIRSWRLRYPEFAAACKAGKALWDDQVEEGLRRRATGYDYQSEKVYCEGGKVTRVPITVHVPPDGWAAFKWLINRRPDQWRDKVDVLATLKPAEVSSEPLTAEQWDEQYGSSRRAN
jgi:hypothetical protein